jgi:NADH-quinone oxidoreductase subunit G
MSNKESLTIHLNDIELQARQGQMLIEVADANGIEIPRFCYHKKLSTSANCRMCLVEVEKAPKMAPACATPVMDGMRAWTRSPKAIAAQKSVMEFLLINHPLDCPVCDQGGECDLQEIALGYGAHTTRYSEAKRIVKDKEYGPLVSTEMTRCIHCTRCVRFGVEIAGVPEIGGTGRGDHMEIGTYVQKSLSSELSGNIIDLCPVGALLSKPFLYSARSWELKSVPGIAPHDAVGSNIQIQVRNGQVMRVIPQENEAINEIWISDRDRFSYLGLNSADRLSRPMMRNDAGKLTPCDWQQALEATVKGLKAAAAESAALLSPSSTVEEFYLLQQLLGGLGSSQIDFRLGREDTTGASPAPQLNMSLQAVEQQRAVLIIGSNLRHEQPLLAHRVRKAALAGAAVSSINPASVRFNFDLGAAITTERLTPALAGVAKAMVALGKGSELDGLTALVADAEVNESHQAIAQALIDGEQSQVLVGALLERDANRARLTELAGAIAEMSGSTLSVVTEGANALGGTLMGATSEQAIGASKALLLMGVEGADLGSSDAVANSDFVVAIGAFSDDLINRHASVVLPMAAFTETSGTFVNMEGSWQSFQGAVAPKGEARPGWKILRVLGTMADLEGFDLDSPEAVLERAREAAVAPAPWRWSAPAELGSADATIATAPAIYQVDPLVRRSEPLQQSQLGRNSEDVA